MAQTEGSGATEITVSVPLFVWAMSMASVNACCACGEPSKATRSRRNMCGPFLSRGAHARGGRHLRCDDLACARGARRGDPQRRGSIMERGQEPSLFLV